MILTILSLTYVYGLTIPASEGANVLILFPVAAKSHWYLLDHLTDAVASSGHNITVISNNPSIVSRHANVFKLKVGESEQVVANMVKNVSLFDETSAVTRFLALTAAVPKFANTVLHSQVYQRLCNGDFGVKFDVAIVSALHNSFSLACMHHLDVPTIYYMPAKMETILSWITATPLHPSYVPMLFSSYSSRMNLWQRTMNTLAHVGYLLHSRYVIFPALEEEIRRALPNVSFESLSILEKNVSMVFVNTHFAVDYVQPTVPRVVHTAGIHCGPAQPLPQKLKAFVEGSGDSGFIIFSLGSVVPARDMPAKMKQMWLNVFSKLKQRVLWKFEEELSDVPDNVLLSKWLPQQDLLGHPKCRLFITHGGILSLQESIYHAVPIIGIPVWLDQGNNVEFAKEKNIGESLELFNLEENEVLHKITTILDNKQYGNNVKKLSAFFKDRPMNASQTIVFYLNYVINHKGAYHLRNEAIDSLNLFQYLLIDVWAALVLVFTVIFSCIVVSLRFLIRLCRPHHMVANKKIVKPTKID